MKSAPLKFAILLITVGFFSFSEKKLIDKEPTIIQIEQNAEMQDAGVKIYIYTTYKDYKGTPFPSNSLIVSTPEGIALIDGGWGIPNTEKLINYCKTELKQDIKFVIGTHFHDDRIGGAKLFNELNIPIYVNSKTAELAKLNGDTSKLYILDKDTSIGGIKIKPNYLGAGHTEDNQVVYIPIAKLLFGGCLVKSIDAGGMGNIADADLNTWPKTIKNVMKSYKDAKIIVPGHGNYGGKNLLKHTLKLLKHHE